MKFIIFSIVILASSCFGAPRKWENEAINAIEIKNFDLMLALLPIYGGFKLSRMINPTSINLIKGFFQKNTHHYESFKSELATEGVFLPNLEDLNWTAIKTEDYDLAKSIVKDTTIKDALEPGYLDSIKAYIDENPYLIDLFKQRIAEVGVTYTDDIDTERLTDTLVNTFTPMISDFLPTAISIAIFGK